MSADVAPPAAPQAAVGWQAPDAMAARPNATDETRLAAGWWEEAQSIDETIDGRPGRHGWHNRAGIEPAPGPAGKWRLHAAGCWVRWVRAVAP